MNNQTNWLIAVVFAVAITSVGIMAHAEIDEKYQNVPSECKEFVSVENIGNVTKTTTLLNCKWLLEETEGDFITVVQGNLTDEEQEVLDELKDCKETDTCDRPKLQCTPPMVLNLIGDRCLSPPDPTVCDEVCKDKKTTDFLEKQYCVDRVPATDEELDQCNSIRQLSECQQGILKLETIQETRSFITTLYIPDWDHAYDYTTAPPYLKKLQLAREECKATWVELYGNILSAEYANKVPTSLDSNPYHADFVLTDKVYPTFELPPGMADFEEIKAKETKLCANSNYKNAFKKMQGCDDKYLLDYPNYYSKDYVVNPTYGVPIRDEGGAYANYKNYMIDPFSWSPQGVDYKYVIIKHVHGNFALDTNATK